MNFWYEWTVLQGNDELLRRGTRSTHSVVEDSDNAVRVTVSTRFTRVGADRQIGVWCIRRSPAGRWNRKLKRTRNPRAVSVRLFSPAPDPAERWLASRNHSQRH